MRLRATPLTNVKRVNQPENWSGVAASDSAAVWRRHPNLCSRTNAYATSANESLTGGE